MTMSIDYTIRSESELLDIIREAIKGGLTPCLFVNGEYYGISIPCLTDDCKRCRWSYNTICGLASITIGDHIVCNGTSEEMRNCGKICMEE